jgi:hypothetical protein
VFHPCCLRGYFLCLGVAPLGRAAQPRFCGATLLATLGIALLAGCDLTGQYDKNFQAALQKSAQRAKFDLNLHAAPTELNDAAGASVGVKLRLPKFFDDKSKWLKPADLKAAAAFVGLPFPDASTAIERQLDDQNSQFLPVYGYFTAIPKTEQQAEALSVAIERAAGAALSPGAKWADVAIDKPDGSTANFKRLQAAGPQSFLDGQKKAPAKVDGQFDLYLIDAGNHHVLIGWRAPKAQAEKYQFEQAIKAAMGTVEITPPTGPAGKKAAAEGCF